MDSFISHQVLAISFLLLFLILGVFHFSEKGFVPPQVSADGQELCRCVYKEIHTTESKHSEQVAGNHGICFLVLV